MKYEKGKRYRVVKPGAKLSGMKPYAAPSSRTMGWVGWSKQLLVGEILTCAGSSMTFGDGVPALKWNDALNKWLANDCLFSPVQGGMWGGQVPEDGYLEELPEGTAA